MLMKDEMDGGIIPDSIMADAELKGTDPIKTLPPPAMESEMIADGALGDDERTETESLDREGKQSVSSSPPRAPRKSDNLDENIEMIEADVGSPTMPNEENKSLNNSLSSNDGTPTGNDTESGPGKKKGRRRRGKHKGGKHHRKYKPYYKLSWSERREVDERETQRANMKREAAFKSGHPVAPYNTTQFLMEDHSRNEGISPSLNLHDKSMEVTVAKENPRLSKDSSHCSGGSGGDSEDEYYFESPNDEEQFLVKDFSEAYDSIHVERLQTMTKDELVKDYLELEAKVEVLEKQLRKENDNLISSNNYSDVNHSHNGFNGAGRVVERSSEVHERKPPPPTKSSSRDGPV